MTLFAAAAGTEGEMAAVLFGRQWFQHKRKQQALARMLAQLDSPEEEEIPAADDDDAADRVRRMILID